MTCSAHFSPAQCSVLVLACGMLAPLPLTALAQLDEVPRWAVGAPEPVITHPGYLDEFVRLSQDRYVILDRKSASLAYFDLGTQEPETVIGSPTFGRPVSIGLIGDSVWVADLRLNVVRYLSRDGAVVGQSSPVRYRRNGTYRSRVPRALLRNSWSVVAETPDGVDVEGQLDTRYAVVLVTESGRFVDTLLTRMGRGGLMIIDEQTFLAYQPFYAEPVWQHAPDGSGVVVVRRPVARSASIGQFHVRRIDENGAVRFDRSITYRPKPITPQVRDSVIDVAIGMIVEMAPWRLDVRPHVERELRVPASFPPVANVMLALDGTIWLRLNTAALNDGTHLVLDQKGEPIGLVELGPTVRPIDASDSHVWVTEQVAGGLAPEFRLSRIPYRR